MPELIIRNAEGNFIRTDNGTFVDAEPFDLVEMVGSGHKAIEFESLTVTSLNAPHPLSHISLKGARIASEISVERAERSERARMFEIERLALKKVTDYGYGFVLLNLVDPLVTPGADPLANTTDFTYSATYYARIDKP
tara:strand:- start:284 stop:697 length:414 start_codon:yes stop_codon:yes gene_type:complete